VLFLLKALIMKCLELFAGKNTFSQLARLQGFDTLSTDWKKMKGIDVVCDIKDFSLIETSFRPDIIWASPECKTFSIASGGTHLRKLMTDTKR
jgi:site-specific DNA-cytosine methylase